MKAALDNVPGISLERSNTKALPSDTGGAGDTDQFRQVLNDQSSSKTDSLDQQQANSSQQQVADDPSSQTGKPLQADGNSLPPEDGDAAGPADTGQLPDEQSEQQVKDGFPFFAPGQGAVNGDGEKLPVAERRSAIPLAFEEAQTRKGAPGAAGEAVVPLTPDEGAPDETGAALAAQRTPVTANPGVPRSPWQPPAAVQSNNGRSNIPNVNRALPGQTQSVADAANIQQQAELTVSDTLSIDKLTEQLLDSRPSSFEIRGAGNGASTASQPLVGSLSAATPLEQSAQPKSPAVLEIAVPVGDSKWEGEFTAQMRLLINRATQQATLQLTPADLGKLEVSITTDGDQAKVQFVVSNSAARDAIEMAMPRLRDMLEQSGLQLAQSDVTDHSQTDREQSDSGDQVAGAGASAGEEEQPLIDSGVLAINTRSSVDYYV